MSSGRSIPARRTRSSGPPRCFKQVLLDDVTAYVNGSPGRFEQYDDGARPIRPLDEFDGVLRSSPALDALVPGLPDHLQGLSGQPAAGRG